LALRLCARNLQNDAFWSDFAFRTLDLPESAIGDKLLGVVTTAIQGNVDCEDQLSHLIVLIRFL
jgi:hypothetical protein